MTRVNVIPVKELSDQHLIAEYRELPRCIKQEMDTSFAPESYCLGIGHMLWARKHGAYLLKRHLDICFEMDFRGFHRNMVWDAHNKLLNESCSLGGFLHEDEFNDYQPTRADIKLNRARIVEKYRMKPNWYRWTNRKKPRWLK